MPVRIASHLYRNRHGTFYFRLVIPAGLRCITQRREIHVSLATEQRREAIIAALPLIEDFPRLLADLKRMANEDKAPPPPDYFPRWIEATRQTIHLKARIAELEAQLLDAETALKKSVPLKDAQRTVKSAYGTGQLKGKRELEERLAFPWSPERTKHFSELQAAYLKSLTNRVSGGVRRPPTPKTLEAYEKDIGFFITVMDDLRIGEINREITGEYFNILRKLPANLSRATKYLGKTIPELLALNAKPQSERNASKKMGRISSMFEWALEEKRIWGIDANPFKGYGQASDNESTRRPFTEDELRALLSHSDYLKKHFRSRYSFWLTPLAVFTGARQGELCQLDLKDFVEVEGVACIDINDTEASELIEEGGRKKRVKNKNAKRLVPIHPELIRMGLLRYVERMRQQGEVHLFNELSRTRRDGPAAAASNWFQRFRDKAGLKGKQDTVFHSFRNLFITKILDGGTSPHLLAPVVGHEADLITGQVYWHKRDATKRKPTVEAFTLPADLIAMFPNIEDVTFTKKRGTKPYTRTKTT